LRTDTLPRSAEPVLLAITRR